MWENLDKPWQEAISLVWEAYKKGTIPIGAVIVNEEGKIIARGQNQVFDETSRHPLAGSNMAHAEMTALFGLKVEDHPNIKRYILYTSLEPCPMCFGTAIMMGIRRIYYGGNDGYAGALSINKTFPYIRSKNVEIVKFGGNLEAFQLMIQSVYEYERQHPRVEEILASWSKVNGPAIEYGKKLHQEKYFPRAQKENKPIEEIYNELMADWPS